MLYTEIAVVVVAVVAVLYFTGKIVLSHANSFAVDIYDEVASDYEHVKEKAVELEQRLKSLEAKVFGSTSNTTPVVPVANTK